MLLKSSQLIFTSCFQKQLRESEYGTDVQSVKAEYDRHQKEHKIIDQVSVILLFMYSSNVENKEELIIFSWLSEIRAISKILMVIVIL